MTTPVFSPPCLSLRPLLLTSVITSLPPPSLLCALDFFISHSSYFQSSLSLSFSFFMTAPLPVFHLSPSSASPCLPTPLESPSRSLPLVFFFFGCYFIIFAFSFLLYFKMDYLPLYMFPFLNLYLILVLCRFLFLILLPFFFAFFTYFELLSLFFTHFLSSSLLTVSFLYCSSFFFSHFLFHVLTSFWLL